MEFSHELVVLFIKFSFFVNENIGYSVGPDCLIIKTIDGGQKWNILRQKRNFLNRNMPYTSGSVDYYSSVFFIDQNVGYVVGLYTIIKTTDGGKTWQTQLRGDYWFYCVYFIDANIGFAIGSKGVILRTTDGGKIWNPIQSGITSELTSISFIDNQTGYISCGREAGILKTVDGGLNWIKISTGLDKYGTLISAKFTDENTGYAIFGIFGIDSGGSQIIKTVDGGKTWNANGRTRQGYLHFNSLYFINANIGYVVGDYSATYKTIDGGLNWFRQQSSTNEHLSSVYFPSNRVGYAVGDNGTIIKIIEEDADSNMVKSNIH